MVATTWLHIFLDERGTAWVEGTNTKVVEIVLDKLAHGWSPEEMCRQHPNLTLAQIHAALGYYHEHDDQINDEIERQVQAVGELATAASNQPVMQKLRAAAMAKRVRANPK